MRPTIPYQPALDGVRALAVVAVLMFHGGVAGFSGGYLGVSVFFTLSGYLITSLLIREHSETGRIDLGAFYARRLRRLLPASALCLVGVVVAARVTDWFDGVENLRDHVLGSVFQVANWVFLAGGGSYQDVLARDAGVASPLDHFWSLAIEEQFYWVWPPLIAVLFRRVRSPRRRLGAVAAFTLAALAAAPAIAAVWGADAVYWATPARLGEILVGAWLAIVLAWRRAPLDRRWGLAAPLAIGLLGVGVATFPAQGGPAYAGGLPLVALVSGALLVGLQVDGPVRTLLAGRPLVALGRISYGVYVFHWPLYLVLDEQRTGLDGPALLGVRLAATLGVSAVSYTAWEQPLRRARPRRAVTFGGAVATSVALSAAAWSFVPLGLGEYWQVDAATVESVSIKATPTATTPVITDAIPATATPATATPATATPATANPATATPATRPATSAPPALVEPVPTATAAPSGLARPARVLVIGDSTAQSIASGLMLWAQSHTDQIQVTSLARSTCGLISGALIGGDLGPAATEPCDDLITRELPAAVAELQPDIVVAHVTLGDVLPRSWDGGATFRTADESVYAAELGRAYATLFETTLAAPERRVVWLRPPVAFPAWEPESHPSFRDGSQEMIEATVRELGSVGVVDLRGWAERSGLAADRGARPDGVHFTPAASSAIAEWLARQLLAPPPDVP